METEGRRRYDERDNVQGRLELQADTPAWEAYYEKHPELKKPDMENQRLHKNPVGHPADIIAVQSIMSMMRHMGREDMVDGPVAPERLEMTPERAAEKIKGWAEYSGIDVVRIGPLDPMYVYSHKGRTYGRTGMGEPGVGTPIQLSHKHAVVLVNGLDTTLLRGAPKKQVIFAIHRAYYQLGNVAVLLARYIRMLGYPARAHILQNYQIIVPPVAVDAGVGEFGRNGLVISREFGQAIKMAVVTTDLPMVHDAKPRPGIKDVCKRCKICAENCPAGAIYHGEEKLVRGARRYPFHPEACFNVWKTTGADCGVCIITCPFSREPALLRSLDARPEASGGALPEDIAARIEQMRREGHNPDAQPHYPWMEEQSQIWRKYRFGRGKA